MSDPLQVLLTVKRLKEAQALKELAARRREAEAAASERERVRAIELESQRTLSHREDAIYAKVIGEILDLGQLDETRGAVVALEREHQKLRDDSERAIHVEARARDAVDKARRVRAERQRHVDKYLILTEVRAAERDAAIELAEEVEIEDQFSRPRRMRPS
jgi:hypothetical protein